MDNSTREVEIEVRGKKEKYIVGKAIFNQKKFEIGDTIEYNLKGKNFEFINYIYVNLMYKKYIVFTSMYDYTK